MSKKLIAVASAAALALSALVAMPSVAASGPFAVAVTGNVQATDVGGATALDASAYQINVPTGDVLRLGAATSATTGTLLRLYVTATTDTGSITATSTNGVKMITAAQYADGATTKDGVTSLTVSAAGGNAEIFAYTTSTAVGTVTVSNAGGTKTINMKGLSTWAYKVDFTAPAATAIGGSLEFKGKVKDAFGNDLTTELVVADFVIKAIGGNVSSIDLAPTAFTYSTTTKEYSIKFVNRDTAGPLAVVIEVDGAGKASTAVTAFGTPALVQSFVLNAADLSAQVTALTAQVAALTADYNKLATRWNTRYDLKKAPKRKVVLK